MRKQHLYIEKFNQWKLKQKQGYVKFLEWVKSHKVFLTQGNKKL